MPNKLSPYQIIVLTLGVIAITLIVIVSIPNLKSKLTLAKSSSGRELLSQVIGKISDHGLIIKVIKYKTQNELFVEIYSMDLIENTETLLSKFDLDSSRDGFLNNEKKSTNLALIDVDNDGVFEVVAPAFDQNMNARLHVFRYNETTKNFEKMQNTNKSDF